MARLRRLTSDICFATASGGGADAVCQALEASCDPDQAHRSFDWRRSFAFSTFTGFYMGGVCSGIYSLYPRAAHGLLRRTPSAREEGLVSTLLDNLVHVPMLYIPSFYVGTSLLRGESATMGLASLQNNWRDSVLACMTFWLPAQFVIFSMVPVSMRVKCVAAGDRAPLPLPTSQPSPLFLHAWARCASQSCGTSRSRTWRIATWRRMRATRVRGRRVDSVTVGDSGRSSCVAALRRGTTPHVATC